jgi:hypothetical protein
MTMLGLSCEKTQKTDKLKIVPILFLLTMLIM